MIRFPIKLMTNPDPNTRKRVQSSDLAGYLTLVNPSKTCSDPAATLLKPACLVSSQSVESFLFLKKPFHFTHTPRRENLFSFSAFQLQVGGQRMRLDGFARVPAKGGEETARWTETEKRVIIRTSSLVIGKPAFGGALSWSRVKEWPRSDTTALWFHFHNQLMESP